MAYILYGIADKASRSAINRIAVMVKKCEVEVIGLSSVSKFRLLDSFKRVATLGYVISDTDVRTIFL